jgi:hypothetical protein
MPFAPLRVILLLQTFASLREILLQLGRLGVRFSQT